MVKFLLCALKKFNPLEVFAWAERRKREWICSGQIWHVLNQMAQAEHASGTHFSTRQTFITWLEPALLYVRYTDTIPVKSLYGSCILLSSYYKSLAGLWNSCVSAAEAVAYRTGHRSWESGSWNPPKQVCNTYTLSCLISQYIPLQGIYTDIYSQGWEVNYVPTQNDLMLKILKK